MIRTRIEPAMAGLGEAVEILRAGEVVGFPTETVYGLGADARREDAVGRIYEVKGRPAGNPVIVHVLGVEEAKACVTEWPPAAEKLAEKFWPGPLTMVLPRAKSLTPLVSAGRSTVAIRCPRHPVAEELLRAFGGPIAAPSANRSGFTSPTTAGHVMAELGGRVKLILDGGASEIGLESTVIDLSVEVPTVLRPGAVTAEMMRKMIGEVRQVVTTVSPEESAASPGLHSRHYAPHTAAFRFAREHWRMVEEWANRHGPVALLSYADEVILPAPHETIRMPAGEGDYARVMFGALREADERKMKAILVLLPEGEAGLWTAIADRLRRATEPI